MMVRKRHEAGACVVTLVDMVDRGVRNLVTEKFLGILSLARTDRRGGRGVRILGLLEEKKIFVLIPCYHNYKGKIKFQAN